MNGKTIKRMDKENIMIIMIALKAIKANGKTVLNVLKMKVPHVQFIEFM